ncbi:MAG: IS21-like element helper ATPase IstB [Gammaproteobacteria bacterium]|nr:IS21-like element helper ATPase IstB [Gammaproteobacteria bacterium]
MQEHLHTLIDLLRLKGMAACLDQVLSEAQHNGTALQEVLTTLLENEYQDRMGRALKSRIKNAKMPWDWSIDTFPFKQQPDINKSQIMSLTKLDFIKRFENVTLIGNPGTGKTGIAISLLRSALINGYRGRFYSAQDLLNELYASLADRTTSSLLNTIVSYDIIVIDELGYLTLTTEQINIFFKLIDMRYHKKSTIITTNLDYPQWYEVFQNKALVDAMLDRFKHYCTTIYIKGTSLRVPTQTEKTRSTKQQTKPVKTQVTQESGEIL